MSSISNRLFPEARRAIDEGKCPFCMKEVSENDFRDELSRKEFKISGLCQECQDETFGE